MTYEEWFMNRTTHTADRAREVYIEITGDEEALHNIPASSSLPPVICS